MSTQKLELTWFNKDKHLKVEPRILIKREDLSVKRAPDNLLEEGIYDNILIHGDNLLALRALENKYSGKIKCIYIDPPYNTGSAFEHYDDNVEHSIWLSLMRERLVILKNLLSDDGSIWISIDDDERDYLKVLCDEVFGRQNFVTSIIWQKKGSRSNDAKWFSDNHDYILIYAKNKMNFKINKLSRGDGIPKGYSNPDNDPRGPWTSTIMSAKSGSDSLLYEIEIPSGRKVLPPSGRFWSCNKQTFEKWKKEGRIWFGSKGDSAPRKKTFLSEVQDGLVPLTVWLRDEVGDNQEAKHEVKVFNSTDVFATPKPERLIQRILTIATNEGDIVLDSFLGSGTTAAVAHKMKRRWIGIELGNHIYTHCKIRIDAVINNNDKGGISELYEWNGGGGYQFYELAPTLIKTDCFGEPIINKEYNPEMLASAIALHEGFTYSPESSKFWKQSKSTENSYLFVTTTCVTLNLIKEIESEMSEDEFLIIACKSFEKQVLNYSNKIKIKKIPQLILGKCVFDKDDYSLNIVNPPKYEDEEEEECYE